MNKSKQPYAKADQYPKIKPVGQLILNKTTSQTQQKLKQSNSLRGSEIQTETLPKATYMLQNQNDQNRQSMHHKNNEQNEIFQQLGGSDTMRSLDIQSIQQDFLECQLSELKNLKEEQTSIKSKDNSIFLKTNVDQSFGPTPNYSQSQSSDKSEEIAANEEQFRPETSLSKIPKAVNSIAELLEILGNKFTYKNQEYIIEIPALLQQINQIGRTGCYSPSFQPKKFAVVETQTQLTSLDESLQESSNKSFSSVNCTSPSIISQEFEQQLNDQKIKAKDTPVPDNMQKSTSERVKSLENNKIFGISKQSLPKQKQDSKGGKASSSDSFSSPFEKPITDDSKETLGQFVSSDLIEAGNKQNFQISGNNKNRDSIKINPRMSDISVIKPYPIAPCDNSSLVIESCLVIEQIQYSQEQKIEPQNLAPKIEPIFQVSSLEMQERINNQVPEPNDLEESKDIPKQLQFSKKQNSKNIFHPDLEEKKQPSSKSSNSSVDSFQKIQNMIAADIDYKQTTKISKKPKKKAKILPKKSQKKIVSPVQQNVDIVEKNQVVAEEINQPQNEPVLVSKISVESMEETKISQEQSISKVNQHLSPTKFRQKKINSTVDRRETTKLLAIVKEDVVKEDAVFENNDDDDFSDFQSNSGDDNTEDFSVSLLPKLFRVDTDFMGQPKIESDNPMEQFIYKLANQLKIDPKQFFNQSLSLGLSKQLSKRGVPKNAEIFEIQSLVKQLKDFQDRSPESKSLNAQSPSQNLGLQSFSSTLGQNSLKNNLVKKQSQMKGIYNSEEPKLAENYQQEMLKNKIQMNIISLALRQNLKKIEVQFQDEMNKQRDIINRHEKKVNTFIRNMQRQEKQLHFAFLFACPLVITFGDLNSEKSKLVPPLNHHREFTKITQRLDSSNCQITITKSQCTIETFRQVLMRKPLGIHFSGHGIQNTFESVGDYHYQRKDEGHFLLLETEQGDSQLVSRKELKLLILRAQAKLDFVFVASCHSEFVGEIFLQAGAKHVICIDQTYEVEDVAVITFTETFYEAIFSNTMNICQAFLNAQQIVSISNSHQQAKIFKLLVQEDENIDNQVKKEFAKSDIKNHVCSNFGPFPLGKYKEINQVEPTLKIGSIDEPLLVGRQKDIYKLIQKILSENSSRLLTLIGFPGIGKSSLARKTLQHIVERRLLSGGYIFLNVHGVTDCENFLRILNNSFTQANSLQSNEVTADDSKESVQERLQSTILILRRISQLNQKILLVIDNAEDLIVHNKNNFKKRLSYLLNNVQQLHILITSNCRIKDLDEFKEEIIMLYELPAFQSMMLFKKLTRPFSQKEINDLLLIKPDYDKYPNERGFQPKKLQDHHLFRLLGGNPTTIVLTAPMLMDTDRSLDLPQLYKTLCKDHHNLQAENNQDDMMAAIKATINISMQHLNNSDPECMELLYFLVMLPGGVLPKDLDIIWRNYSATKKGGEKIRPSKLKSKKDQDLFVDGVDRECNNDFAWHRAFLKLKKNRLIEEKQVQRQNTNEKPKIEAMEQNQQTTGSNWRENTILSLPIFVQKFAESQISEELLQIFHSVLSEYFKNEFAKLYEQNRNDLFATNEEQRKQKIIQIGIQINKFQGNFQAFISRMKDLYTDEIDLDQIDKSEVDSSSDSDSSKQEGDNQTENQLELNQKQLQIIQNNQHLEKMTPHQRAQYRWKLAMRLLKPRIAKIKLGNVKFGFNMEGNDSSDSENEFNLQKKGSKQLNDKGKKQIKKNLQELQKGESLRSNKSKQPSQSLELGGMISQKHINEIRRIDTFRKQQVQYKRKFTLPTAMNSKGKSQMVFKQKQNLNEHDWLVEQMPDDEMSVIYYLTNLLLQEQYSTADQIIEKQLLKLKKCSDTFNGNIRRLHGLCQVKMFKLRFEQYKQAKNNKKKVPYKEDNKEKIIKIKKCLDGALNYFEKGKKNLWGIALTNFQYSDFFFFLQVEKLNEDGNITANKDSLSQSLQQKQMAKLVKEYTKASDKLNDAQNYFEEINHFRGHAQSIQLSIEFEKLRIQKGVIKMQHSASVNQQKITSQPFGTQAINKSKSGLNKGTQEDPQITDRSIKDLEDQLNKCMREFRSKQNQLHPGDVRLELFISRQQGEKFSLITEIVRGIPDQRGIFSQENSVISESEENSSDEDSFKSDKSSSSEDDESFEEKKPEKKTNFGNLTFEKKKLGEEKMQKKVSICVTRMDKLDQGNAKTKPALPQQTKTTLKFPSGMMKGKSDYPGMKKVGFANEKKQKQPYGIQGSVKKNDRPKKRPSLSSIESDNNLNETPESPDHSPSKGTIQFHTIQVPQSLSKIKSSMQPSPRQELQVKFDFKQKK